MIATAQRPPWPGLESPPALPGTGPRRLAERVRSSMRPWRGIGVPGNAARVASPATATASDRSWLPRRVAAVIRAILSSLNVG
jgi:hypothetical protein